MWQRKGRVCGSLYVVYNAVIMIFFRYISDQRVWERLKVITHWNNAVCCGISASQLDVCRTYDISAEKGASALIHYWWVISNVDLRFELIHLILSLLKRAECTRDRPFRQNKSSFLTNSFSCGISTSLKNISTTWNENNFEEYFFT